MRLFDKVKLLDNVQADNGDFVTAGTLATIVEILDGAYILQFSKPNPKLVGGVQFECCTIKANQVEKIDELP